MGVFGVQVRGADGTLVHDLALPNRLARESMNVLYHRLFPPHAAACDFRIVLAGCSARGPSKRPNPLDGVVAYDHEITWEQVTETASEGGGYTDNLRAAFGYEHFPLAFTCGRNGEFHAASEVVFEHAHLAWAAQDCDDYDWHWTPAVEECPPLWGNGWREDIGQAHGFPWYNPRKKCDHTDLSHLNPTWVCPSYWHSFSPDGELDWLCNFYQLQFPITGVALVDEAREKVVATALLPGPITWWPGLSIHVTYRGLFEDRHNVCTTRFLEDFAQRAFANTGFAKTLYVRPVLATAPPPSRDRTYSELVPHFVDGFEARELGNWVFVDPGAGLDPPYLRTPAVSWLNETEETQGPFQWLAVFAAGDVLYMLIEIPPATIPHEDTLRLPQGVKVWLDLEL